MKLLTFPVSRLTRRLMLHRYGAEPIQLDRADIRRKELMHTGPKDKHLERKQYSLDTTVTLSLNRHEYEHAVGKVSEIGYYLYQQDKHRIFRFVWARVTAGLPALQAIYDYYSHHGIEEDDFAIETAERLWKRWRVEKEKERVTNTPECVPRLSSVLLSERQADNLVRRLHAFIDNGCIDMDPRYRHALAMWVYCDLTSMTVRATALKMNLHYQNVGRSVVRFREYLPYNEDLRKHIAYCLRTTQARPTPSAAS